MHDTVPCMLLNSTENMKVESDDIIRNFLTLRRIPAGIIGLLSGLYSGTESVVKCVCGGEGGPASFLCIRE